MAQLSRLLLGLALVSYVPYTLYSQELQIQNLSWQKLDNLLNSLEQELIQQNEDLETLSKMLEESQIEINKLQSSLKQLEQQLINSEQSMKQIQNERTLWKTIALISSSLAISAFIYANIK